MTSPTGTLTVGSVMHRGVVTCRPNDSLRTVAAILAANTIHAVVTERDDGTPIGILSSLDVAAAVGRQ